MAFRLKNCVFRVKCRQTNCPFDTKFEIKQNIMGITEDDVENEAKKIVRGLAMLKHDAIYGRTHSLTNPLINKTGGSYENIGTRKSSLRQQDEAITQEEYTKGDLILEKGAIAPTICEVINGYAYPDTNKSHKYQVGDSFGVAALLFDQKRSANIIAGENGTQIAFYNLQELSKKKPDKARELYNKAMEDVFGIMTDLTGLIRKLERKLEKEEIHSENLQEQVKSLKTELKAAKKSQ